MSFISSISQSHIRLVFYYSTSWYLISLLVQALRFVPLLRSNACSVRAARVCIGRSAHRVASQRYESVCVRLRLTLRVKCLRIESWFFGVNNPGWMKWGRGSARDSPRTTDKEGPLARWADKVLTLIVYSDPLDNLCSVVNVSSFSNTTLISVS